MTNTKKTKQALLSSVIALIVCLSMLVGTTFAWFTDSVTSGNNKIVAGNLDIELEYLVNGKWVAVDSSTNVFGTSLWEPGHTEVVYLRVINQGTLALKYQLGINVAKEVSSINVYGEELVLSDIIEFGVIEGENTYATREDAVAALTGSKALSEGYSIVGDMEANDPAEYLTLVVYMPETVGNEANYMTGKTAPEIDLGINLMATQKVSEDDTFGNDYDVNAGFNALPGAPFRKLGVNPTVTLMNSNEQVTLDTAYEFKTTQTVAEAEQMDIASYNADFVISFNKDVAANTVVLAGQYDTWSPDWVALAVDGAIAAGEQVRLLSSKNIHVTYTELCDWVQNFKCGAADLTGANAGTVMTVELRLFETYIDDTNSLVETGESIVAGSYSYTFPFENKIEVTPVKETITCYDYFGNTGSENIELDFDSHTFAAENFQAQFPVETYGDWSCDYFVSTDAPVAEGMVLAGNYAGFGWIGIKVPASTTAYAPIGLLTEVVGTNYWTYEAICNEVGTFLCGVDDVAGNNAGVNVTVTLRLTSPNGAQTIDVSTITVTL